MFSLSHVIALLDGSLARLVKVIARRIRHAGPVNLVPMTRTGNDFSAQDMLLQHLSSPAKPQPKKRRKAAQRISVASKSTSKKSKPAPTEQSPKAHGNSTLTPVSKIPQPVKQALKRKQAAVQSTPQEQSPQREQVHAQTPMDNPFGVLGKPKAAASKTPQPALPESKAKPKRAQRTKAGSKPTLAKAPAKTRTARPSWAAGS